MNRISDAIAYAIITAAMVTMVFAAEPIANSVQAVHSAWFAPPAPAPEVFRVDVPSVSIEYSNP